MHKLSGFRDYLIATLMAAALFAFLSFYLFVRRGYFFDAPLTADPLFIPNKALASTAMMLLAFIFLLGPLSRYFDRWDHLLAYRKEIGIVAGFLALLHGFLSYFFLPHKFPREWIDFTSTEFGAGLIGALLLFFLFILSLKLVISHMNGQRWWLWQRWGLRLAIIATLLHVFIMKLPGWLQWIRQGGGMPTAELANPWMPGLGLLTSLFITWVVLIRLYETLFLYRDLGITPKEISLDPVLRFRGRRFFQLSFFAFIALLLFFVIRWL